MCRSKISPDWIGMVTSRFTELFYCERENIAYIQSEDTLELDQVVAEFQLMKRVASKVIVV